MRLMKKLVLVCVCAVMAALALPEAVKADEYYYDEDYQYSINDDGDTITITDYYGYDAYLDIPSYIGGLKVTAIGAGAFEDCDDLEWVAVPSTVMTIGTEAFEYCDNLETVRLSNGLTTIGSWAFYSCTSLSSINIPKTVTSISTGAFSNSPVTIACVRYSYGYDYATGSGKNYTVTTDLSYSKSGVSLGGFSETAAYTGKSITFSRLAVMVNGVRLTAGTDYTVSYSGNKNVGTAKLTIIGKGDYSGTIVKRFRIKILTGSTYTVNHIKYRVTNAYDNQTHTVAVIGTTYKTTDRSFTRLTIASSVTIGGMKFYTTAVINRAFKDYRYLKRVDIASTVKQIGAASFYGCSSLTTLVIGSGARTILQRAFARCPRLVTVVIKSPYLSSSAVGEYAFTGISSKASVKVPAKKLAAYRKLLRARGVPSKAVIRKL